MAKAKTTKPSASKSPARAAKKAGDLSEYQAKRNFSSTPEPSGKGAKAKAKRDPDRMFCVQKHLASHLHYDFRLEHNGVLLSWAVPKGPSVRVGDKRLAMRTEDHPYDYGDFEGVIPEGYGAGIVVLWDKGTWEPEAPTEDVDAALEKGELKFTLEGEKLQGSWVLVRTRGFGGRESWLLMKHRDRWAADMDITEQAPWSVKSGGDFVEILADKDVKVWESNTPAKGGDAGKMFRTILEQAAKLRGDKAVGAKANEDKKKSIRKPARSKRRG
jgi:bifunctional non-homologous end joining protein LigD